MGDKGRSDPNLFGGGYTHYDDKGHKTGRSEPNIFGGGYTHYDANGHKTGRSERDIFGGYVEYDEKGHKIGHSDPTGLGSYSHYDAKGHKTGESYPGIAGSYSHSSNSDGCYIATCVYGSYDCPPVWTLRRFRDGTLANTRAGRAFIRAYYAVSPKLVQRFGQTRWFCRLWRGILDRMVHRLQAKGVEGTPYEDKRRT